MMRNRHGDGGTISKVGPPNTYVAFQIGKIFFGPSQSGGWLKPTLLHVGVPLRVVLFVESLVATCS